MPTPPRHLARIAGLAALGVAVLTGCTVGQNASIGGVQVQLDDLHGDALTLRVTRG